MSDPWDAPPGGGRRKPPLETVARDALVGLLKGAGLWHLKTTSGGMQRRGTPDILGVAPNLGFAVELKRDRGHDASPLQRKTLEEFAASGGLALIARGVTGANMAFDAIRGKRTEEGPWLERVSPR